MHRSQADCPSALTGSSAGRASLAPPVIALHVHDPSPPALPDLHGPPPILPPQPRSAATLAPALLANIRQLLLRQLSRDVRLYDERQRSRVSQHSAGSLGKRCVCVVWGPCRV